MPASDWMAGHPTREELHGFLLGKLAPADSGQVLAHLVRECPRCREVIAPLAEAMFHPLRAEAAPPLSDGSEYDFALRRFGATLRREAQKHAREREAAAPLPTAAELLAEIAPPPPLAGEEALVRCEALLEVSWDYRHDDPEAMVALAEEAAVMAHTIDPAACPGGARGLADLQARAHAALANARRVANDPRAAEADLHRALRCFDEGTGDRLLLAHLMSLAGSLFQAQRRFGETEKVLSLAFGVYADAGERHLAGKALLQQGLAAGYGGDPRRALHLVHHALTWIEPGREPKTTLDGLHNLVLFFVDCGKFDEASTVAWAARDLYASHGGEHLHLKLGWLEGRIAAGLGHPGRAERCFRQARAAFLRHGMPYTAAIVALDLGVLFLAQGRTAETRVLIRETLDTFKALRIPREAAAAVLLLREAARQDRLSATILRSAAADLQKVRS